MDNKINNGKDFVLSIKIDSLQDLLDHNQYTDNFELVFVTWLDKNIPLTPDIISNAKKIILKSNGVFDENAYDALLYIYKNYEFNSVAFRCASMDVVRCALKNVGGVWDSYIPLLLADNLKRKEHVSK